MNASSSFDGDTSYSGEKLIYPAATRNKQPILEVLQKFIKNDKPSGEVSTFLEIASGSGQHVYHFAPHFPWMKFQPTDYDKSLLGSLEYYANACETNNILPPKLVDICDDLSNYGFEENSIDYIYNANMMHISPFECTIGLFKNAGIYLKNEGLLITYGPYSKDGVLEPKSNVSFNESLKARNSSWGIRDITTLEELANDNKIQLQEIIEMPANNKTLIWKKEI